MVIPIASPIRFACNIWWSHIGVSLPGQWTISVASLICLFVTHSWPVPSTFKRKVLICGDVMLETVTAKAKMSSEDFETDIYSAVVVYVADDRRAAMLLGIEEVNDTADSRF